MRSDPFYMIWLISDGLFTHKAFLHWKYKMQAVEWDKAQSWDSIPTSFNLSTVFNSCETTQDASAMDKHIHQRQVYKAMEKQHSGIQQPVKDYWCMVNNISYLHAGHSLKGAVIVIGQTLIPLYIFCSPPDQLFQIIEVKLLHTLFHIDFPEVSPKNLYLRDLLDLLSPWEHQLIFPRWNWTAFRLFDSYFMMPFESLLGFTLFRGLKQLCFFSCWCGCLWTFIFCSLHHTTEQSQSLWRLSVLCAVPQVTFFHWCPLWVTLFLSHDKFQRSWSAFGFERGRGRAFTAAEE